MSISDLIEECDIREEMRRVMTRDSIKKSERPVTAKTDEPRHEYHNAGGGATLHRIVAGGLAGQWVTYQQVATLKTPSGVLHACTDYFHGSLPTNAVFTIQEIK